MILGFRANIDKDSHRVFLTRLQNHGVNFKGIPTSDSSDEERSTYSFIFDTENDFRQAQTIKRSMTPRYSDIPTL